MSSYHTSFRYLEKNSYDDFNLQIVHFEGGDNGETDSYLSQDSIYADSQRGTKRILYGTKYNSVASLSITVMNPDGTEFSIEKTRQIYKWLTGATQYNWMDLYVGNEVKYRMLCFVQDVKPYKIDSRVVGFTITVESSSPWCYSPLITETLEVNGSGIISIDNLSDDLYTYTQMTTVFKNTTGESLTIYNDATAETTTVNNLGNNEIITLSENMFITSDNVDRIFGTDFNYTWPKLKSGINNFTITGTGSITFQYIYCMKVGDCVGDLNASSEPICNEGGQIILDKLPWGRISEKPTTLAGYGVSGEVNDRINGAISNVYTKSEIDNKLKNVAAKSVQWIDVINKPTTLEGYGLDAEVDAKIASSTPDIDLSDYYTIDEIDELFLSVKVEIDEDDLVSMLNNVLQ